MKREPSDLLIPGLWKHELPWGNSPDNALQNFQPEEVQWNKDGLYLGMSARSNEARYRVPGTWVWETRRRAFQGGLIVSEERYHFGIYECECHLPDFRGSWPAFWMIDTIDVTQGGQGIPPETDIMEQFRKDGFLSRFTVTSTVHYGKTYSEGLMRKASRTACFPYDRTSHLFRLEWSSGLIRTLVDGKEILKVENEPWIPQGPMNIILNSGLGDWGPETAKFSPFKVKKLTYEPW